MDGLFHCGTGQVTYCVITEKGVTIHGPPPRYPQDQSTSIDAPPSFVTLSRVRAMK